MIVTLHPGADEEVIAAAVYYAQHANRIRHARRQSSATPLAYRNP
jgi:hypothetical protein